MTFHIITLFPHAFDSYLGESILKRAILDKKITVKFYNPRDFAENKWRRIDRAPYGGGPGMVIQAEPVLKAVEAALRDSKSEYRNSKQKKSKVKSQRLKVKIIWLSPSGKQFTNEKGITLAKYSDLVIICGRYEGIDARVKQAIRAMRISGLSHHPASLPALREQAGQTRHPSSGRRGGMPRIEEISVGPFVLTGGELPAMLMIDVIARQVPGVLGDPQSREEARITSPDVYTRPEVFDYRGKKFRVPKVLLTGHHAKIDEWRQRRKR